MSGLPPRHRRHRRGYQPVQGAPTAGRRPAGDAAMLLTDVFGADGVQTARQQAQPMASAPPGPAAAIERARAAHADRRHRHGPADQRTCAAAAVLVDLLLRAGHGHDAIIVLDSVVALHANRGDDRQVLVTLVRRAEAVHATGGCDEAATELGLLWQVWRAQFGPDARGGLHVILPLVGVLAACGRHAEALRYLAEADTARPVDSTADIAHVGLRYGRRCTDLVHRHRRVCTATASGRAGGPLVWDQLLRPSPLRR